MALSNINGPTFIHHGFMIHFPLKPAPSQKYCSEILKTFNEKHKTHADKVGKYMCICSYYELPRLSCLDDNLDVLTQFYSQLLVVILLLPLK